MDSKPFFFLLLGIVRCAQNFVENDVTSGKWLSRSGLDVLIAEFVID